MIAWLQDNTAWMYWTWPSGLFFIGLFAAIAAMGVWDKLSPSVPRKGFLPITTTRGDRLFIGILSAFAIFFLWLAFAGTSWLWCPLAIAVAWFGAVMARA